MKKIAVVAVLAALTFSTTAHGDEIDQRFPQARDFFNANGISITTSMEQARVQNAILVMGEGVPKKGAVGGQKRLTAITAAKVVAQRRLAEFLDGVTVIGTTTIGESQRSSETLRTTVSAFVKGAQPVVQEWNAQEETALVILQVGMNGPKSVAAAMYDKVLADPAVARELDRPAYSSALQASATGQPFDGLIIDASEFNFRPALINRIFSTTGEVLYDPARISQRVLIEQGCGEYTNSIDKARAALGKRAVKNPLIVKASGIVSPADLRVSDETAAQIFAANQASGLMADARVAFVLK